ncbi:hypothetical protein KIW84_074574 [Lathyrus oleraceus]|uniref:PHD finger protein ALFIN-LIKE n=1 Tax=Pisum sativum TaxID=3888 RepID=A0A9D4VT73_PEA|nr:hypothetical protein KIW84_074574 [Pisum sativum]
MEDKLTQPNNATISQKPTTAIKELQIIMKLTTNFFVPVFGDFKGRRAGLIKTLTTDVEDFYNQCDPDKENLCLYGFPSEQWEVNLPAEEVPPELPEPVLGINFARDSMPEKDWLSLVVVHSDSWLLAIAYYFGARFGFDNLTGDAFSV